MKQVKNTQVKTQNILTKKAGRVVAVAMALLVLIFALFLLLSPMKASNFFGTLGFKNWSVSMAYSAAEDSGSFDDWWCTVNVVDHEMISQLPCTGHVTDHALIMWLIMH